MPEHRIIFRPHEDIVTIVHKCFLRPCPVGPNGNSTSEEQLPYKKANDGSGYSCKLGDGHVIVVEMLGDGILPDIIHPKEEDTDVGHECSCKTVDIISLRKSFVVVLNADGEI